MTDSTWKNLNINNIYISSKMYYYNKSATQTGSRVNVLSRGAN